MAEFVHQPFNAGPKALNEREVRERCDIGGIGVGHDRNLNIVSLRRIQGSERGKALVRHRGGERGEPSVFLDLVQAGDKSDKDQGQHIRSSARDRMRCRVARRR